MYFSETKGVIPVQGPLIAGAIPGMRKKGVSPAQDSYNLNALAATNLFPAVTRETTQASTVIQSVFVTPSRLKIPKINAAFTGISALDGSVSFNIVVGTGSYALGKTPQNDNSSERGLTTNLAQDGQALFNIDVPITLANFPNAHIAGVAATGTLTLTGVPLDTFDNVYVINGITTTSAQATANSLSDQATADAAAITADTATNGVTAAAVGAVITLTANVADASGNLITTTASSTGGDSVAASQATLAGGFNTGGSSGLGLIPTHYDAVFACGAILTLRIVVAGGASITNFMVSADTEIQPLASTFPSQIVSPAPTVPIGAIDF